MKTLARERKDQLKAAKQELKELKDKLLALEDDIEGAALGSITTEHTSLIQGYCLTSDMLPGLQVSTEGSITGSDGVFHYLEGEFTSSSCVSLSPFDLETSAEFNDG